MPSSARDDEGIVPYEVIPVFTGGDPMELKHTATRAGRLSSFLKEELHMSTGLMNRMKWQDKLFVNGIPRHADYAVQIGDGKLRSCRFRYGFP